MDRQIGESRYPRWPWQWLDTREAREYHQSMSIWNKVLIGFIFVVALGFFYVATRTLKTHAY